MMNEKRLIDVDAAIDLLGCEDGDISIKHFLKECPTVDAVEVVHGHKVVRERNRGIAYAMECPICGSEIPSNKPYTEKVEYCSVCRKRLDDTFQNYCPNCGAKMDGDGSD